MLLAKELQKFLFDCIQIEDANTIKNIIIATLDGGILGFALQTSTEQQKQLQETTAALFVTLLADHSSLASNFHCMLVDCEKSKAVIGRLGQGALILCIWGEPTADTNKLFAKFEEINSALADTLKDLY